MGCVQLKIRPRITLEYDLGNIPSSESSPTSVSATPPKTPETSPTANPLLQKNVSDFVKFRRAAHQCYFCGSNYGLLCRPFTCRCNFYGHYECFKKWIEENNFRCSICKNPFYDQIVKRRGDRGYKKALCMSVLEESVRVSVLREELLFLIKKDFPEKDNCDERN